jgi:hypothetical protein
MACCRRGEFARLQSRFPLALGWQKGLVPPMKSASKKSNKKQAKPVLYAQQASKSASLKESAPMYKSPFKKAPLPQLKSIYAQAVLDEQKRTHEERLKDWTHVKPSDNGTNSRRKKVTFLLPASGSSFQV